MKSSQHLTILTIILILLGSACTGRISGESSGQFEVNRKSETVEERNGVVTKRIRSNDKIDGAFEHEFHIRIENGDTIIQSDRGNKRLPDLSARGDCSITMSENEFILAKEQVLEEFMDTDKLLSAKVMINQRCMNSNQIRDILSIFTLDKYRLDFAKFAYGHTSDKVNFYRVKEAFSFSSTKEKLDNYINSL